MNLEDALGGWPSDGNNQGGAGPWPGPPPNPTWPGQPAAHPAWPGGQSGGGGLFPGQPSHPAWDSPQPQPTASGGWASPSSQQSLVVPYQMQLPSGVYDKLLITITGTIKPDANRITVDLATSSNDLAFHFNPRFNEQGKQVIVRNSRIRDAWGREEREQPRFPFARGQPFELKILCTTTEYKVAANNSHLLTFKHRVTDLRSINTVRILYDLTLSRVNMETLS
uniref:galectin-3b n=1 Tax=Scatophagus argus TaxID=75038 RepID=UPI001ED85737|nr:galectin-3b [Scatophagus argus]